VKDDDIRLRINILIAEIEYNDRQLVRLSYKPEIAALINLVSKKAEKNLEKYKENYPEYFI
jgi:hypothetical protein